MFESSEGLSEDEWKNRWRKRLTKTDIKTNIKLAPSGVIIKAHLS